MTTDDRIASLEAAVRDQGLELLVNAQAEHLFAPAGGVASAKLDENRLEEVAEFKGVLFQERCDQFFRNKVRPMPEISFSFHHMRESSPPDWAASLFNVIDYCDIE